MNLAGQAVVRISAWWGRGIRPNCSRTWNVALDLSVTTKVTPSYAPDFRSVSKIGFAGVVAAGEERAKVQHRQARPPRPLLPPWRPADINSPSSGVIKTDCASMPPDGLSLPVTVMS